MSSLMLLSSLLTVAQTDPVHGTEVNFVTFVDARTTDPFGGFWQWTNETNDVVGNIYSYEQILLRHDKGAILGLHAGYCIRTDPGMTDFTGTDAPNLLDDANENWKQCSWTVSFGSNSTFENNTIQLTMMQADFENSTAAIIGGTGAFQGAYGFASFDAEEDPAGGVFYRQEFNFTIDLELYEGVTDAPSTTAPATFAPGSSASPKSAVVRMFNTSTSEIQVGVPGFLARLRALTGAVSTTCEKICHLRRKFRETTYVELQCYSCAVGGGALSRAGEVLAFTDDYAHELHVSADTRHTAAEVSNIITTNFAFLTAAISPYVMLSQVNQGSDDDDEIPALGIFAIVLISVIVIGVVALYFVMGKKGASEQEASPTEPIEADDA
eukprot:TRINITY_DN5179_c0_g3_i1.p1 TRINITY_DN5179_c0_g3~~TRINITY_DN5179_c0_g3_i1.p1  ORF type:complete len:398 (+),score=112.83 TRINITY_DN5179_c0_g3_i1:51-1196(+)